jgi:hypothetical protein
MTSSLLQDAFLAEERLPCWSNVFGDKTTKKLLDNFVVGVSKAFMPLDTVRGWFVGHGGYNDGGIGRRRRCLDGRWGMRGEESPTVVGKFGVEGAILEMEGHAAFVIEHR